MVHSKATVGLIVNPAAGKDIRRVVARGRFVADEEKVNIVTRILAGLSVVGIERVLAMPDSLSLTAVAAARGPDGITVEMVDTPVYGRERDSTLAAEAMARLGVGCIVTLGGDGTNRAVALAGVDVPMVPVSTGTNNVFPVLVEGTTAGLAAGVVATGAADADSVTSRRPMLEVTVDGERKDVALIDAAVSRQQYVGARAIWDIDQVEEIFVTGIYPTSIGLASIAASLPMATDGGLYVHLGPGGIVVSAPVTPGMFSQVSVAEWSPLPFGEARAISLASGTIAVDGERSVVVYPGQTVTVMLVREGPRVVDIERALAEAGRAGAFVVQDDLAAPV